MGGEASLRELATLFSNLTINVTVASGTPGSATVTSVSAGNQPGSAPPISSSSASAGSSARGPPVSDWASQVVEDEPPAHVRALACRLRSHLGEASPADRIRTAYLRGREGAEKVRGERRYLSPGARGERKVCYVVLRCSAEDDPFFTQNVQLYLSKVKSGPAATWDPDSVSFGFSSLVEAEAFCYGAGLGGLPRRLN